MAGDSGPAGPPRHFFLNETHELATLTPDGGGRSPNIVPPDWSQKAVTLRASFDRAASYNARVRDPSAEAHRFVVTIPAPLTKLSASEKAKATGGKVPFTPSFGGAQSSLLAKLGFDLLELDDAGNATVHVPAARVSQVQQRISALSNANSRERLRWINVGDFRPVDWTHRVDAAWLDTLDSDVLTDSHLRFHAVLPRAEVRAVLEAMQAMVPRGERLVRVGRDFSGRYWCIAQLRKATLRLFAEEFPSLQSLHPRLSTPVASRPSGGSSAWATPAVPRVVDTTAMPTIGMFDTGVPDNHPVLKPYIRSRYVDPTMAPELAPIGDHGSQVASALVFGHRVHTRAPDEAAFPPPTCRVFDMLGGWTYRYGEVPDELWDRAIDAVIATSPDVRVFNLSLGGLRLADLSPRVREEKLRYVQDLDNHAFTRDILLVYSAGNSHPGVAPSSAYPGHLDDEAWQLGVLALNFNGLVVGAHVNPTVPRGISTLVGAPSPFTRIGPGMHSAPVPSFSAPGGDSTRDYARAPESGVWVFDAGGAVKDCAGTSYAAPLVAREAAFAFQELSRYCPDERPFAATVRAWLTLDARRPTFKGGLEKLAKRTVGGGFPSSDGLRQPDGNRAVFVWQTLLESTATIARVAVPVPQSWLERAAAPQLRLVVAWLTPVNAALTDTWSCRKVSAQLRTTSQKDEHDKERTPLRASGAVGAFPVIDRTYDIQLARLVELKVAPVDDLWALSVSYEDLGPPPAGMEFAPQQRVGVVIELTDQGDSPVSPQAAVQALNIPAMNRLSVLSTPLQVPLVVR